MRLLTANRRAGRRAAAALAGLAMTGALASGASASTGAHRGIRPNRAARVLHTARPAAGQRSDLRLSVHELRARVLSTGDHVVRFPSAGGPFIVRLTGLPRGSVCIFSAGRGVALAGRYHCGGRLFLHRGTVRPNTTTVAERWPVRVSEHIDRRAEVRTWTVLVQPSALAPVTSPASSPPATTPPSTTPPTTVPPTTTTPPTTTPPTTTAPTTTTLAAPPPPPQPPQPGYSSSNWSGYVLQTAPGGVQDVQGSWTVPTLDCTATPDGSVAQWIGVDGTSTTNGSLFQTGTDSACSGGVQQNVGWVENLPALPQDFALANAGDVMAAHVWQYSPGSWQFTLEDLTAGWDYTLTSPDAYAGTESSADWVVEDPTDATSGAYVPFADFGTTSFSAVSANLTAPTMDLQDNGVELVQNSTVLALPSDFAGDGFSVTYG